MRKQIPSEEGEMTLRGHEIISLITLIAFLLVAPFWGATHWSFNVNGSWIEVVAAIVLSTILFGPAAVGVSRILFRLSRRFFG